MSAIERWREAVARRRQDRMVQKVHTPPLLPSPISNLCSEPPSPLHSLDGALAAISPASRHLRSRSLDGALAEAGNCMPANGINSIQMLVATMSTVQKSSGSDSPGESSCSFYAGGSTHRCSEVSPAAVAEHQRAADGVTASGCLCDIGAAHTGSFFSCGQGERLRSAKMSTSPSVSPCSTPKSSGGAIGAFYLTS